MDQARGSIRVDKMQSEFEERSRIGTLSAQDEALRRTFTEMLILALRNPLVSDNVVEWTLDMVSETVAELEQIPKKDVVERLKAILAQPEAGHATQEVIDASYGQTFDHLLSVIKELEGEAETLTQVKEQAEMLRLIAKREYLSEQWTEGRVNTWIVEQTKRLNSAERQQRILQESLREQDVAELQDALHTENILEMIRKFQQIESPMVRLFEDGHLAEKVIDAWHLLAAKKIKELLPSQMEKADTIIASIAGIQRAMSNEQNVWKKLTEDERMAHKVSHDKLLGGLKLELKRLEQIKKGAEQFFKIPSRQMREQIVGLLSAYEGKVVADQVWTEFMSRLEEKKKSYDARARGNHLDRPPVYYDWGSAGSMRTQDGTPSDRIKYGRIT